MFSVPTINVKPFKDALKDALRACPLSRDQVADRMSMILGKKITIHEINTWTAQSKEAHLPRTDELIAFHQVVGRPEPINAIAAEAGLTVIDQADARILKIAKLKREKLRIQQEIERLTAIDLKEAGDDD